jgi:hypothetical protein
VPPLIRSGPLLYGGLSVLGGAAVGVSVRLAAGGPSPPEKAAAAMTVVLAAAVVAAASIELQESGWAARIGAWAKCAGFTWLASAAAGLAAGGGAGALGAALVPAGAAALALGIGAALRACGCAAGPAAFGGTALACVPAALLFVADPWIDWRGGTPESPERARIALAAQPLAAMTSGEGGLGVDFQRMPWLYDGPAPGVPGLSLVGQYYPAIPPSPVSWGGTTLATGAALVFVFRRRR